MTDDREDRLGRLCEELEQALAAGESLDRERIAAHFGVHESDVDRLLSALQVVQGALDEEDLSSPVDLAPPDLPDDYELLGELGRGGMGIVYRAHQKSLDRDLAVKVLRPGDLMFGDAIQRFEREAKSLARLRHRHIVSVHEVGKANGFVYFTMDLIDGRTLAERLCEAPMTTAQTVRLMRQVTSAIAYAHGKGVMHRDLKPANILIDQDEDAFVVDFGLARDLGSDDGATISGQMLGTPAYMSPEQALGDRERIGEPSDVYALGAILYECLTGCAPFDGLPLAQLIHAVVDREPEPVRRRNPRVPPDLQVICQKAMQKDPTERYATVQAFAEDLERFAVGRPILARPRSLWSHSVRFVRRNRRTIVGAAVPAAVLLLCAWWFVMPAIMRGRTLALAERLHAAGSPQAAVAAYRDAYADVDPKHMPLQERVRYLRALIDEAGRLYVRGGEQDPSQAEPLLEEAKRVLGQSDRHGYWQQFDEQDTHLVDELRLESLRLEPFVDRRGSIYHFNPAELLRRIVSRDQEVGREADLIRTLWSIPTTFSNQNGLSQKQREAILTLLPVAGRLPPQLQRRLRWIARVDTDVTPYDYVDEAFLERLVTIADDRGVPLERRKDAACLFHQCGWMPFLTSTARVADDYGERTELVAEEADLTWLRRAWDQLRGLDRIERHRRRVDLVVGRLAAIVPDPNVPSGAREGRDLARWVGEHTGCRVISREDVVAWWQEHRTEDPRDLLLQSVGWQTKVDALTVDDLFERLRRSHSSPHVHHLLALSVDEAVPVPDMGTWSRSRVLVHWQRALGLPMVQRMLRVATFAMVDGEVAPRLIRSHQVLLGDDAVAEWAFPVDDELPFLDAAVGWRPARARVGSPLRVLGEASLSWQGSAARLQASSWIDGTWPVWLSGQLVYGGDRDVGDGLVGFLGGVGWRVGDGHARFDCFTLATLQPVEQQERVWTREDWIAACAETLDRVGAGDEAAAINNAKHVAFATFFPLPRKLAQLQRFDEALGGNERTADYCMFIRKASRLLAGDEQAIAYDTSASNGHTREFLDAAFWVRLASVTSSKKLRDHAFAELRELDLDAGLLRTIARIDTLAPHLPEWIASRAGGAPSRIAVFLTSSWWLLLLLPVHLAFAVLPMLRLRRGVGARRSAAILLVPAGLLLPLWSVWIGGREWNPTWLGHAVHVLGVWAFCWRATRGPAWQFVALLWTGTTAAYVTGNLDHPAVVWTIAALAVLTLPMHKAHVSVDHDPTPPADDHVPGPVIAPR